jgi:anti-sigma regulatory factor (Ser/Thr protein kinase)
MTMQAQYRHEAVPYEGEDDFVSCGTALAEDAGAHDAQLLFLLTAAKTAALRDALGDRSPDVTYVAMDEPGRNPARLLALLEAFRAQAGGRRCVSVNEPVLAGVSAAAVAEAQFGESVLNAPALQSWPMSVHCLYDAERLDETSRSDMHRTHPSVQGEDGNSAYEPDLAGLLFAAPLPAAPPAARRRDVRGTGLGAVREFIRAAAAELVPDRREDLVLAANEIVTNSLQHGGGECRVSVWVEANSVVCEVRDAGRITDPMVGRLAPARDARAGRGLWLANHLCDLVQVRSSQDGTTVRLFVDQ